MSGLTSDNPWGVLRPIWSAAVGDYAIAGGWTAEAEALVVGDAAGGVHAFDGKSGAAIWSHADAHEGGLLAMAMHPGKAEFASAGQDGRVLIWDARKGQITRTIDVGNLWVESVAYSPGGQWLAASCGRQIRLYHAHGSEAWRSGDHPSTVSAIAWADDDELATACYGRVTFFDAKRGEEHQRLEWKGSLVSLVLSPNGDIVACGSQDNTVHFWRRSTEDDSMVRRCLVASE
jgi:WD40 repeat protein